MTVYSTAALRAVALRTQGLHAANGAESKPTRDVLYETVNQIGCVQIDTISVVARSHYLTLWSRLGNYAPTDFDALQSGTDRRLFEGWQHAACYIPLAEYCYQMPHQRNLREHSSNWYARWLNETHHTEMLPLVLERIRREGALKVSDFERGDHPAGVWWNWRPAKVALEYLYAFGDLMVAGRVKFQRIYDLTGRVLPEWVDTREPTPEERDRFWIERGAKALGVFLLDLDDPGRVIHRPKDFIFEPQELWELRGDVPNVVFSCANPVVNGVVHVYYGAADHVIGLATCPLNDLLDTARFG
ncbi:MAG: crosslink repair DNA glycosylase YcaQ family protein [Anaerolineales bacterium]|nr:crosslink repair DNA glycosylase YcaQ family protein [Anaerolineales bacterium]